MLFYWKNNIFEWSIQIKQGNHFFLVNFLRYRVRLTYAIIICIGIKVIFVSCNNLKLSLYGILNLQYTYFCIYSHSSFVVYRALKALYNTHNIHPTKHIQTIMVLANSSGLIHRFPSKKTYSLKHMPSLTKSSLVFSVMSKDFDTWDKVTTRLYLHNHGSKDSLQSPPLVLHLKAFLSTPHYKELKDWFCRAAFIIFT